MEIMHHPQIMMHFLENVYAHMHKLIFLFFIFFFNIKYFYIMDTLLFQQKTALTLQGAIGHRSNLGLPKIVCSCILCSFLDKKITDILVLEILLRGEWVEYRKMHQVLLQ